MSDYIDLEQANEMNYLDVGGTPANLLAKNKISMFLSRGIKTQQIIAIVDPFDLSRVERSLELCAESTIKRIKFSTKINGSEKISSERVACPNPEEIEIQFSSNKGKILDALYKKYNLYSKENKKTIEDRYNLLKNEIINSAKNSLNLREFMNSLISIMSPVQITLKRLEDVLAESQEDVFELLKQRDIEARVFCPGCGLMKPYTFKSANLGERVCCTSAKDVISSGSYVPEEGMLPALAYIAGINPCIVQGREYGLNAIKILKDLGRFDRPFVMYSGKPDKTMFEEYLLRIN